MEGNQSLVDNAAPPAYEDTVGFGLQGQSTQPHQGYNVHGNPPPGQQGYNVHGNPPPGQQGYNVHVNPPPGQQGYNPQGQPQYTSQGPPGYAPQGQQWQSYPIQQQQPMANVCTTNNVTVVQASSPVVAVFPSDNSGLAWFACLCCFWPLGIVAIIYSCKARDAIDQGDLAMAIQYSRQSRNFSHWAIGLHISVLVGVPILIAIILGVRD